MHHQLNSVHLASFSICFLCSDICYLVKIYTDHVIITQWFCIVLLPAQFAVNFGKMQESFLINTLSLLFKIHVISLVIIIMSQLYIELGLVQCNNFIQVQSSSDKYNTLLH